MKCFTKSLQIAILNYEVSRWENLREPNAGTHDSQTLQNVQFLPCTLKGDFFNKMFSLLYLMEIRIKSIYKRRHIYGISMCC